MRTDREGGCVAVGIGVVGRQTATETEILTPIATEIRQYPVLGFSDREFTLPGCVDALTDFDIVGDGIVDAGVKTPRPLGKGQR